MTRRDAALVLGTLVVAVGLSALLYVGTAATAPSPALPSARPRVFFDVRNTPPPARALADAERNVPGPLQVVVPLQRGVSEAGREAAGFLLTLLLTASTLVLANDQVVATYRATLGDWRAQGRLFATGAAVIGFALSAIALGSVVFLGLVAGVLRGTAFGAPAALQLGLTAFGVLSVLALLVLLVGFAAASWRLGDALLRLRWLSRFQGQLPAPLVALAGATLLYLAMAVPVIGAIAVLGVVAYALGAVVTARLTTEGSSA